MLKNMCCYADCPCCKLVMNLCCCSNHPVQNFMLMFTAWTISIAASTNNNIQHKSYVFMAMVRFEQQGNCSSSQQHSKNSNMPSQPKQTTATTWHCGKNSGQSLWFGMDSSMHIHQQQYSSSYRHHYHSTANQAKAHR